MNHAFFRYGDAHYEVWTSKLSGKPKTLMAASTLVLSDEEADEYFNSRARLSRIGAWASMQSRPLDSRKTLINRVKDFENKFDNDIPRPEHWGGFALSPIEFEFWQDGEFRLHDRFILKPSKKFKTDVR